MSYKEHIHPLRRSVPTPAHLVEEGKAVFGTFESAFQDIDLMAVKNPTAAPDCLKRLKLTLWEATEIHLEEGVLLAACCDMGLFGQVLHIFYDKRKKKVFTWSHQVKSKDVTIATNLVNGSRTFVRPSKKLSMGYVNNFQEGKCTVEGYHNGPEGHLEYSFALDRISKPSVVSIPFDEKRNRPLYSQKDFFHCTGTLTVNGETFHTTATSTAVVDDHKGFYPRRAHYDWVTTMGINETDGEKKFFAFNLTRNQSIHQDKYNENLIWLEKETSLLPPVTFTRNIPTLKFKDGAEWTIKDDYDMVNIQYAVYDIFRMVIHAKPFVNIEYFITFGELTGYVRDENGKKYILDGMLGIGEDKDMLL